MVGYSFLGKLKFHELIYTYLLYHTAKYILVILSRGEKHVDKAAE